MEGILRVEHIQRVEGYGSVAEGTFSWSHIIAVHELDSIEQTSYPECNARVVTCTFKGLGWEFGEFYIQIGETHAEEKGG